MPLEFPAVPSEECAVEGLPYVAGALSVDAGCRFLFVVLKPGHQLDESRHAELQRAAAAGGRGPDAVYAAPVLPCAEDGQVLRSAVRRLMMGESAGRVAQEECVANPDSLLFFALLFNNL